MNKSKMVIGLLSWIPFQAAIIFILGYTILDWQWWVVTITAIAPPGIEKLLLDIDRNRYNRA